MAFEERTVFLRLDLPEIYERVAESRILLTEKYNKGLTGILEDILLVVTRIPDVNDIADIIEYINVDDAMLDYEIRYAHVYPKLSYADVKRNYIETFKLLYRYLNRVIRSLINRAEVDRLRDYNVTDQNIREVVYTHTLRQLDYSKSGDVCHAYFTVVAEV